MAESVKSLGEFGYLCRLSLAFLDQSIASSNDLKPTLNDKCVQCGNRAESFLNLLTAIGGTRLRFAVCR